ncbi:MAG: phosphoenolpyruvate carboxykinase domain-containing protein, partial [Deltaproteobacteria bacterium]|nr:phosphoenolpyruvate carboxykinase domain-containing protein [Deltaproteobacteria bacterium]
GKKSDAGKLPRIFYVNWFRKTPDGRWLWPGYGENSRILKWIFERIEGTGKAVETPIGYVPAPGAIDTSGLNISDKDMAELLKVDTEDWLKEVESIKEHYNQFGDRLPQALRDELAAIEKRLSLQKGK